MNTSPIICSGNELEGVLAGLRARGCVPESVDAMVKTNAGYQVNYFERVPSTQTQARVADSRVIPKTGSEEPRTKPKSVTAGILPAALNPFPHQDETQEVSIETRLAALQERLRHTGKLRLFPRRQRTKPEEARHPHAD